MFRAKGKFFSYYFSSIIQENYKYFLFELETLVLDFEQIDFYRAVVRPIASWFDARRPAPYKSVCAFFLSQLGRFLVMLEDEPGKRNFGHKLP